jgi:putative ABC transport system permease protein
MGVLRYKILRDLWSQKARTLQVMLIIGIGAAAIGMIMTTRNLVIPGMQAMWQDVHPAMINLFVGPSITEDELIVLQREEGVVEVEGLSSTTIEWRLSSAEEWRSGGLTARADYQNQLMNKLDLVTGEWPRDELLSVENGSDTFFQIPPTGQVQLRINDREYQVQLNGTLYNPLSQPALFGGTAQFYAAPEFYEELVGNLDFGQVLVRAGEYEETATTELADRLQDKITKMEKSSGRMVLDPNKHFFQDQLDGVFSLLGILGTLSLVLGLLLVYTTINAVISQQVNQIGVMKAVGARTSQVLALFLFTVFIYGVLALVVALPLGIFGGWAISSWLVNSFGADVGPFEVSVEAIVVMVLISLLAPMLAAMFPILSGARITVREAITTYGLSGKTGLVERLLNRARRISRLLLLTISNTFRHKGRVILLQISLVISGLIFMMVVSVRDSVVYTIRDVLFSILSADATYLLEESERISYIEDLSLQHPEVEAVEVWGFANVTIRPKGQPESDDDEGVFLFGVPLPTQLYGYQLREGRWLNPDDTFAVVLNQKLAEEAGVGVGDWITVHYAEKKEQDWQVVGLIFDPILTNSANVPRDVLQKDTGGVGRASSIWIKTKNPDKASDVYTAKQLRDFYEENHVEISPQRGIFGIGGDSSFETGNTFINQFNFLVVLLSIMAVIIGLVGSIALSGALSLSVLERRREIGVMRAIGASSWAIFRLFIGEGLILGWLSWLLALPLSLPSGKLMVAALGSAFNLDLVYKYTPFGAILWLVIITFLSIIASWLPAGGATRVSVRESLAYQ